MGALDDFIQSEYITQKIEQSGDTHFTCFDAEESILRRMLKSQDVADDVSVSLSGKDFANLDYGRLFCAIQDVIRSDRHIDAITVEDAIGRLFPRNAKKLRDMLAALMRYREPTADDVHNIAEHVEIVKALAMRRNAQKQLDELMRQLANPAKDIHETLLDIRDVVDTSGVDNGGSISLQEVLMRTYEHMEAQSKGEIKAIKTGLPSLDRLIGGFYGGELTVIGARPSVGKSAFLQFVSLSAARAGHKIGFVSCEMVDIGFGQRIFANLGMIDGMAIRRGELSEDDWAKCGDVLAETQDMIIDFKFDSTYIEDIVQWAKRKARRGEMDMLAVDYLQIVDAHKKFESEHLRVGYISRMLKNLSRQLKIPVVVAAQVNRETDGSMPTLRHLKDSGSIEQDADNVMFLHRPKDANDPCVDDRDKPYFDELAEKGYTYMCIGVSKQRQGSIGMVSVLNKASQTAFTSLGRD